MLLAALLDRIFEFAKQFLLLARQVDRRFDQDVEIKIARVTGTHVADALVAQTEGLAALRAFGDRYARLSFERRHFDFAAERRRRERNRQIHMKVITVALENLARTDADFDVEIACSAAVEPRLALANHADALSVIDAGRNIDLENLGRARIARALAIGAGFFNHLARTVTARASLLNMEDAVRHADGAAAAAGRAGLLRRAGFAA